MTSVFCAENVYSVTIWMRNKLFYRFVRAIIHPAIRGQFLYMPSQQQQQANMDAVLQKYKLHDVIAGIDGCHFTFSGKPRGIPVGRNPRLFINRYCLHNLIFIQQFNWLKICHSIQGKDTRAWMGKLLEESTGEYTISCSRHLVATMMLQCSSYLLSRHGWRLHFLAGACDGNLY